jgi:hypothetical protein
MQMVGLSERVLPAAQRCDLTIPTKKTRRRHTLLRNLIKGNEKGMGRENERAFGPSITSHHTAEKH